MCIFRPKLLKLPWHSENSRSVGTYTISKFLPRIQENKLMLGRVKIVHSDDNNFSNRIKLLIRKTIASKRI